MRKKLLIIAGPTGVGKTDLSIKLAQRLNGEIISADSMQIYTLMDIGSAKVRKDEMQNIEHHLIDVVMPNEPFNVVDFKTLATNCISEIYENNKLPIVAGGTGLYVNSLICNMNFTEAKSDVNYRIKLEQLAVEKGNLFIHSLLEEVDEISAKKIHPNNLKRVIRALEVYHVSGKPFSSFSEEQNLYKCDYDLYYYVLTMDREKLYTRINERVDIMIKSGLVEECIKLKSLGYTADMQSIQGIGYKEVFYYLDGKISLEEAIDMIKQGSRNYAKRQLTWFRKDPRAKFIDKDKYCDDEIIDIIINEFNN